MKIIATLLLVGFALVITGVYLLVGIGWAMVAAGAPFVASGLVMLRGLAATEGV